MLLGFSKKKLVLAFEYGVILAQTARDQGIELTPEHVKRAEVMLQNEFKNKSYERVALDMIPNILSAFETN